MDEQLNFTPPENEQDELLSDIPAAVTAGTEEHTEAVEAPQPPAPQPGEEPEKPRKAPPDTSVLGVGAFMGALILLFIPIVNFICAIKWTFRRGYNRNRRNLGIASLLLQLIFIGLVIGGCVIAKYQFNYDVVQHLIDLILNK